MPLEKKIDVAVVILSSDGYSDAWPIFFHFFEENSGLEDLPRYLLTQQKTYEQSRVKVINCPNLVNQSWSTRIKAGLREIGHEYVLLFTEDLLCTSPCSAADWRCLSDFAVVQNATCIRLCPSPPPHRRSSEVFSTLYAHELHRVSLQTSLWKRSRLLELIIDGETPWEFEVNGSRRSGFDQGYFCANYPLLNYLEVIGRGRITRKGARLIRAAGLGAHLTRETNSYFYEIARNFGHLKARFFYALPSSLKDLLIRKGIVGKAFRA
jgi:hypothetical protein